MITVLKISLERAPPKAVISKRLEYLEKFESHVEQYDRYQSLEMYKKSCHAVAKDRFHTVFFVELDSRNQIENQC